MEGLVPKVCLWMLAILVSFEMGAQWRSIARLLGDQSVPQRPAPDLIFRGGEILTLDPEHPRAEALAVADGRVLAIGSLASVMETRGQATTIVDLNGKVLMPSLKDHHLHLLNIGFALLGRQKNEPGRLDLTPARSLDDIARLVAEAASRLPKGSWILGAGWNQGVWGGRELPSHEVLTRAAPEHPVYLIRVDGHCGWANAAALRAAGITQDTPDPPGGAILRLADGSPSGILLERANEPLLKVVPPPSEDDILNAFRLSTRALAAQGVTEVFDAGFLPFPGVVGMGPDVPLERYFEILKKLDQREPLPIRVNLMIPAPSSLADAAIRDAKTISPRLRVTHIKLFVDGALGSRGAALSHLYEDDPSMRGVMRMTVAELEHEVQRALGAGLDVATHAIGDAAVERTLDVYESGLRANPKIEPGRLRIDHFSYASASDIERAARLRVAIVIQPGFVYPDAEGRAMEDARLGHKRSERAYPWGRLQALGAKLVGSSDDFSFLAEPFWNFYAAATRKNPAGQPPDGWHPSERLSREASLALFTALSAPGGRALPAALRPEAAADFIIVSGNPLQVKEPEILKIKVHATLLAGQPIFTDGSIEGLP